MYFAKMGNMQEEYIEKMKDDNERSYRICPKCKQKCYYYVCSVDEESGEVIHYCCECNECEEILDED